jgi:hypothetical protein
MNTPPSDPTPRPVISIITPTRNAAATLARCLKSVAIQRYPNWEHWILDAVSEDETVPIASRAAAHDPRIHVVSQADLGIYDAMNKGIRLAHGEWLYFLGADDELFDADVLSSMLDPSNADCDILYGNVLQIPRHAIYDGPFDLPKLVISNISHQAIFYRRALFERLGGFDLRFPVQADWEFNLRCMLDPSVRFRYVETVVARFQQGGTSGIIPDPAWRAERPRLLGRHLKLGEADQETLRALLDHLIRQDALADTADAWRKRHDSLLRVHNDLLASYGYRLARAISWPGKVASRILGRRDAKR